VTGHGGLNGMEMLRILHSLDNRFTDGGEFVSLAHRKLPFSASGTHFCQRLSKPQRKSTF
jgi:hypothetical protein